MSVDPDEIRKTALFAQLDERELKSLSMCAMKSIYQENEWIVYQGETWPYLFLVVEGEIHAVKESIEGRALIATNIKPGEIFWGLAFFIPDATMPVSLKADKSTRIFAWHRMDILPIIQNNGKLGWKMCEIMISRMKLASEIVEDLAFQPVMGRLADLLLEISANSTDQTIARQLTLDEMAARIGSTREMVCRYLYRFAEKGAIEISRTEFKIKDREFLEQQLRK